MENNKSAYDPEMDKYCDLMEEIKRRVNVIDFFLSGSGHAIYKPTTVESTCLQIRKVLELIAMGSLIANKNIYSTTHKEFSKHWNAELLLRDMERLNHDFYPTPVIEIPSETIGVKNNLKKREGDFLTKAEFVAVYKKCGAITHTNNPYGSKVDYAYYDREIPIWRQRIINLLNCHEIRLVNDPGFYLIHMREDRDNKVHFYKFAPVTK